MKATLLNRRILAVVCGMALCVGMSMPANAQHKKKKHQQQVQQQQNRTQYTQQGQQLRQPDKTQHEQRLTVYRQRLGQQQQVYQQNQAQLQQEKRNSQLRYQRQYSTQMLQQQRRYGNTSSLNYQNDPYFRTPYDRRYSRGGTYYETNRFGETQLQQAVQYGYSEGFRAGMADRQDRWQSDYERSVAYQDANYGYNGYYVPQDDYSYYFREGFRRGYEDGYNGRSQYGRRINGRYSILGSVLGGILSFEMMR